MTNKIDDDLRYKATILARRIAKANFTNKATQMERATHYIELARDPEFLSFIKDIQQQVASVSNEQKISTKEATTEVAKNLLGKKFDTIDFDQFKPFRWTNYIPMGTELEDIQLICSKKQSPNILIEADAGTGKTTLAYELGMVLDAHVVAYSCSSGTREGDLRGRTLNTNGLFQLGYLVVAVEIANETGICILYLDELNALEPELQKMLNSLLDDRRMITANGKVFKLNKGSKLIVIATMNPSSYAGTVPLNPDLRSRFWGNIWNTPTPDHLMRVVDWTNVPEEMIVRPLIQLAQDTFNYKVKGDTDYVCTTRDLVAFADCYRMFREDDQTPHDTLEKALQWTIYIKFGDKGEKELIEKSAHDTFPDQPSIWSEVQ